MRKEVIYMMTMLALVSLPKVLSQDSNTGSHNLNIVFPAVALLDLESTDGNDLSFVLEAPGLEAGEELEIHEQRDGLWINYTSLVSENGTERSITVKAGNVPEIPGLTIRVIANLHSGQGGGSFGMPTSAVVPGSTELDIITGIGSAFTGNGVSNGHKLIYFLDYTGSFEGLRESDDVSTVTLTYTITD